MRSSERPLLQSIDQNHFPSNFRDPKPRMGLWLQLWDWGGGLLMPAPATALQPRERRSQLRQSRGRIGRAQQVAKPLAWPVRLFIIGLSVPWIIPLGGLNLTVYRIVLLATIIPCLVKWLSGHAGRIRIADIGLILFSLWAGVCLAVSQGFPSAIQSSGILLVETVGAYMLARCYIRSAEDFHATIRLAVTVVILIAPFTIYEWLTFSKPILSVANLFLPTVPFNLDPPRMGLWRAQGPFSHPIEFGLFCSSLFALAFLVLRNDRSKITNWILAGMIIVATFTSMSSAPIAGLIFQIFLISWNYALEKIKFRWILLWLFLFAGYLVVEFGSNQTPIQFYISHFTFSAQTGWWRLLIWEYGTASVANHPLFGIGFENWARPAWMASDSIDNFWLANAIRYGVPGLVFLAISCFSLTLSIGFKRLSNKKLETYRLAYIACMLMYFFVGSTVHFWAATYVWFLFLLGSGVWIIDTPRTEVMTVLRSKKRRSAVRPTESVPYQPNAISEPSARQARFQDTRRQRVATRRHA